MKFTQNAELLSRRNRLSLSRACAYQQIVYRLRTRLAALGRISGRIRVTVCIVLRRIPVLSRLIGGGRLCRKAAGGKASPGNQRRAQQARCKLRKFLFSAALLFVILRLNNSAFCVNFIRARNMRARERAPA